jgi:hypothetical protein
MANNYVSVQREIIVALIAATVATFVSWLAGILDDIGHLLARTIALPVWVVAGLILIVVIGLYREIRNWLASRPIKPEPTEEEVRGTTQIDAMQHRILSTLALADGAPVTVQEMTEWLGEKRLLIDNGIFELRKSEFISVDEVDYPPTVTLTQHGIKYLIDMRVIKEQSLSSRHTRPE